MDYSNLLTGSFVCTMFCKYHTDIHLTDNPLWLMADFNRENCNAYPNKIYIYNSSKTDSSSVSWWNKRLYTSNKSH
jgi:hypothetical protein